MITHYLFITVCQPSHKTTPGLQAQEWPWQTRQAFKALDQNVVPLCQPKPSPTCPVSRELCTLQSEDLTAPERSRELFRALQLPVPQPSPHQVAWGSTKLRPKLPVPQGNIASQWSCLSDPASIPQRCPVTKGRGAVSRCLCWGPNPTTCWRAMEGQK